MSVQRVRRLSAACLRAAALAAIIRVSSHVALAADGKTGLAAPSAVAKTASKTPTARERPLATTTVLHRPAVPPPASGSASTNPIDRFLQNHLQKQHVDASRTVSDAVFARRVSLDLVGLLPAVGDLDRFVANTSPDKRSVLVVRLLQQREDYAVHWLAYWNDLLRNEYRGTGYIDDGRRQITEWLFRALYENKPYDRFVHELIAPVPGSEGFTRGIQWRGVVNASQRRELQAAQTTAQVFLGANLKCASCHDSFTNQWTLADSHGLAAVFADGPLEVFRCDKSLGERATARFLFPEVGSIDAAAPRAARVKQLADVVTAPRDGRLATTIVNRLWARLFGRGLIEPLDNMDQESWHPELLDWLAADLVEHRYDLKHTLEIICGSRAYQLPSVGEPRPNEKQQAFVGPLVRRMTAEQFIDAVATVTGVWPKPAGILLKQDGRGQGGQLAAVRKVLASDTTRAPQNVERVRAALAMADPLAQALSRPTREQVVTRRDSLATMLQALELTNGKTLDAVLRQAGHGWAERAKSAGQKEHDAKSVVDRAFRTALGRRPTDEELAVAAATLGSPPSAEGIQDLLWMIVMLPEFQLIL